MENTDPIIIAPPNSHPANTIWAFVSEDDQGNHGIIAELVGNQWMTMVTMEPKNLASMKEFAKRALKGSKRKIKIATYTLESMVDL